jgi:UDP-galactopyranose mutase
MPDLVVFSHLRWDHVVQRPQHIVSRLAERYRVLYFEEPAYHRARSFIQRFTPCRDVEVLRPHTPILSGGFHDDQIGLLAPLLEEAMHTRSMSDHVAWLYTPMALPLAMRTSPMRIVYDCMDELSAFKSASRQLSQREQSLMRLADVVFTGGPSLYRSRAGKHPNLHCFPSSVDTAHFERARGLASHPLQAHLPRPRLGFFGVIDERMDYELVDALARTHPEWQIVMAGPVAKMDPTKLPRAPNLHWIGRCSYAELPALLAGWDVCLLPFALNEATCYISPTKTLEYLAAGKPVVSSPLRDVVELYGDAVHIGKDAQGFIAACETALAESFPDREQRLRKARAHLARTSWDSTVRAMCDVLRTSSQPKQRPLPRIGPFRAGPNPGFEHIVAGAGPTGLSAAYHLGASSLLLEQNGRVGGWCASIEQKGFTFDHAGHIMFSKDPYVLQMYDRLLGDNVHWQDREAWIYSHGVYTRYPYQGALYGLPPQVLKECLIGAIEARFGPLKGGRPRPSVEDEPPRNFEEFIYRVWGTGVAEHFAIPYNRKLWAVPLDEMETSWLGGRVPLPDLEEMIEGALSPAPKPMGPNARFGYPLRGGFQALMDGFLPLLEGEVRHHARICAVSPRRHQIWLADGSSYRYDNLISTLPLPRLIELTGEEAPGDVREATAQLRHVSVRCVNLGIARPGLTDKHWIYYPGDTVFHRIFVQGNASPYCNPPGGFGLTCEITYSTFKPLCEESDALIARCIEDCRKVDIVRPDDFVMVAIQLDLHLAYVV